MHIKIPLFLHFELIFKHRDEGRNKIAGKVLKVFIYFNIKGNLYLTILLKL